MQATLRGWRVGSRQLQEVGLDLQAEGGDGEPQPKGVLVLGRRWDSLCLAEAGGQDKAVVWVRVAHELLPAAVVPGPSVMGSGGQYCHPTGQYPSGSIEREVSMVLMGKVPLLPRQCPAL